MKENNSAHFIKWRFYSVLILFFFIVFSLSARVFYLSIIQQSFLKKEGNARSVRVVKIPSYRGMITDRNGDPLAISTQVYSIWANPNEIRMDGNDISYISKALNVEPKKIKDIITRGLQNKKEFVYLKRSIAPKVALEIKAQKIPGLYLQEEYKRSYPEAESAAHVVGFTNIDDQGQEGLELAYNQWLAGSLGKKIIVKDRLGRVISHLQLLHEQKPGNDLVLSIDRRIQYLAYRELLKGIQDNVAKTGSVVVLDVKTGEILAMVNYPSYNPNNRVGVDKEALRNRAVTDVFEPGSTIKAFSIATALDSGLYTPETIINTYPGWLRVGRNIVKDEHEKGPMTVTRILQISSNVGVTKIMLSLPPHRLSNLLHRVGIGESTAIGFPGERAGVLIDSVEDKPFGLATLAFGYGLSVTPLQLAEAYAIFANDGIKIPLSILRVDQPPKGKRVIKSTLAKEMVQLLETVVSAKGATGGSASVPGYRVAGKTGTSILADENGYKNKHYVATFVGMAPASNPKIIVAVIIQDPKGKQYYGGPVSGPVFEKIMEGTLRILDIPPDNVEALEKVAA